MIDDCQKPLIPNLKSFCCLRHLIEMNKVCEERMISHKYYKYILRFYPRALCPCKRSCPAPAHKTLPVPPDAADLPGKWKRFFS